MKIASIEYSLSRAMDQKAVGRIESYLRASRRDRYQCDCRCNTDDDDEDDDPDSSIINIVKTSTQSTMIREQHTACFGGRHSRRTSLFDVVVDDGDDTIADDVGVVLLLFDDDDDGVVSSSTRVCSS
jgi:hypothetical protein